MKKSILRLSLILLIILVSQFELFAQEAHILSQRKQSEIIDQWLGDRLDTIVPYLMRR